MTEALIFLLSKHSHDFYVSYHQSKISWSYARNYDGEC